MICCTRRRYVCCTLQIRTRCVFGIYRCCPCLVNSFEKYRMRKFFQATASPTAVCALGGGNVEGGRGLQYCRVLSTYHRTSSA